MITIVFPLCGRCLTQELSGTCHFLSKNLCPLSECGALLCRRKSFAGYDDSSNGRFKRRMLHLAISATTISIWLTRFPLPSSLTRPTWGSYVCNLNVVSREGGDRSPYFPGSCLTPASEAFQSKTFRLNSVPDSERWANYTFIERVGAVHLQ